LTNTPKARVAQELLTAWKQLREWSKRWVLTSRGASLNRWNLGTFPAQVPYTSFEGKPLQEVKRVQDNLLARA
jgi:hypothetical protein